MSGHWVDWRVGPKSQMSLFEETVSSLETGTVAIQYLLLTMSLMRRWSII